MLSKWVKNLSFPDTNIEKMDFFPKEKKLILYVDSAWLDREEGIQLGKGVLFFCKWEKVTVRRYDSEAKKWSELDEMAAEKLKDLCEVKFLDDVTYLCGFGVQSGQWLEWKIVKGKMSIEF